MKYNLTVKPLRKPRTWVVVEGFTYAGVQVTPEFQFDGCSIPWFLQWLFKHGGAKFPAGGIHDFLYRTAKVCKERADCIFKEVMLANGVHPAVAEVMYLGVKYFGKPSWNKRRKEQNEAIGTGRDINILLDE